MLENVNVIYSKHTHVYINYIICKNEFTVVISSPEMAKPGCMNSSHMTHNPATKHNIGNGDGEGLWHLQ